MKMISDPIYYSLCLILVAIILFGIYLMSKVKTARLGNMLSAFATFIAVILTIIHYNVFSNNQVVIIIIVTLLIGSLIGAFLSIKVKMIQMPELVALLNGFGGLSSALVGIATLMTIPKNDYFNVITSILAIVIGTVTLTGSLVASGKLAKLILGKSIMYKGQASINVLSNLLIAGLAVLIVVRQFDLSLLIILLTLISGLFGVNFTIKVGGADMPITISLLNSLSGVAGSIAGMAIGDPLLVAVGGIVGSSGLVLTQIMCKAMNRHLFDILLGKTSVTKKESVEKVEEINEEDEREEKDDLKLLVNQARDIIIVPGYGMALSQAQHVVKELTVKFEEKGANVRFAIHPVAGRMPGHMNILLAEVDIDYDKLYEMDSINDDFKDCDLAIVIGANDVLNPAARDAQDTPIYGMPILNVDEAKHIIICNYDLNPGYSGVDNPLYKRKYGLTLLLGDAKDSLKTLINQFE